MSMQDYPNFGYVVPIEDILPILPERLKVYIENGIEAGDTDWDINESMPQEDFPSFELFYTEDTCNLGDNMEHDKFYALFSQEVLYDLVPRKELKLLQDKGISPTLEQWTTWG